MASNDVEIVVIDDSDSDDDVKVLSHASSLNPPVSICERVKLDNSCKDPVNINATNRSQMPKENSDDNNVLCNDCGKYVPIDNYELHCGRCKRYHSMHKTSSLSSADTSSSLAASTHPSTIISSGGGGGGGTYSPHNTSTSPSTSVISEDSESALQFLSSLLPSWSHLHLNALLKSHESDVQVAYEAVSRLSKGCNPDDLPVSFRQAILLHHKESESELLNSNKRLKSDVADSLGATPFSSSSSSSPSSWNGYNKSHATPKPFPCFNSYAYRLFTSMGTTTTTTNTTTGPSSSSSSRSHNMHHHHHRRHDENITFGELVPDDSRLREAVVFNMMIDWQMLTQEVPALNKLAPEKLTIIYGDDVGSQVSNNISLSLSLSFFSYISMFAFPCTCSPSFITTQSHSCLNIHTQHYPSPLFFLSSLKLTVCFFFFSHFLLSFFLF
jgi:hypothetical protein